MQHRLKWQMASLLMLTMWAWGWRGTETKASKVAFFDDTSTTDLGAEGQRGSAGWLVDFQDSVSTADIARMAQEWQLDLQAVSLQNNPSRLYRISNGRIDATVLSRIKNLLFGARRDPRIESIEPDWTYSIPEKSPDSLTPPQEEGLSIKTEKQRHAVVTPNDPLFDRQWHMQQIHMPDAWSMAQGEGVIVAVVDTGISPVEDLAGTDLVAGWNFVDDNADARDDHGHGTHVAGTIAQTTNNRLGVTGVAYRAKLMPIKVLSANGSGGIGGIAAGIRFAVDHGAQVINMSLGGPYYSKPLAQAVAYAYKKGVTVVCAAGNDGKGRVSYPAANPGALAVSATQFDESVTFYSNWGKQIAIAAPGGNTRVDQNNDGIPDGILQNTVVPGDTSRQDYLLFMGTSMASPHVAGVAALIHSAGVHDPDRILQLMQKTAHKPAQYSGTHDNRYGAGIVDAKACVEAAYDQKSTSQLGWLGLIGVGLIAVVRRKLSVPLLLSSFMWVGGMGLLARFVSLGWLHKIAGGVPNLLVSQQGWTGLVVYSALLPVLLSLLVYKSHRLRSVMLGICLGHAAILFSMGCNMQPVGMWGPLFGTLWSMFHATFCFAFSLLLFRSTHRAP